MKLHLHIVAFDIPYPPNYGGVIDVFYKLKFLQEAGVAVTLHAFQYGGRTVSPELGRCCRKVYIYPRRVFVNPYTGKLPYIVATRADEQLLQNLLLDEDPVLFEGLHTTFYLTHTSLANRFKMVRMHNIEHDYYRRLEETEPNLFRRYFFHLEAKRLSEYEDRLHHANVVLAISPNDTAALSKRYEHTVYIPAFHANEKVTARPGSGSFCFYHGKLSVGENDQAAGFLVQEVFNDMDIPLVIAGDKPGKRLRAALAANPRVTLKEGLTTSQIRDLTANAHINVVPTFQSTGIKLKLLNVLFQGRHVLANTPMVSNTGLAGLCHLADTAADFKQEIIRLMKTPFGAEDIEARKNALAADFDNRRNAAKLISLIKL